MTTKVKIDWYKPSGKWHTSDELETDTEVWNTQKLMQDIGRCRNSHLYNEMDYVFEAITRDEQGIGDYSTLNKRLVKVKQLMSTTGELKKRISSIIHDRDLIKDSDKLMAIYDVISMSDDIPVEKEEKEWEVIEYKSHQGIWYRCTHPDMSPEYPNYVLDHLESVRNTGPYMKGQPEEYQIHAIKTKTGEVYRIGDRVATIYGVDRIKPITVAKITIEEKVGGGLALITDDGVGIALSIAKKVEPVKPVLLVTEDGKEIVNKNIHVYGIDKTVNRYHNPTVASIIDKTCDVTYNYTWFSTSEARTEWIEYNKPCLSQKEVIELITTELSKPMDSIIRPTRKQSIEMLKCALDTYVMDKLKQL